MAARKLKFKPKPTIGGLVRKAKEKDEIPELIPKEPVIPDKENLFEKRCEGNSLTGQEHIENTHEEKVLKKLKTDNGFCVSQSEHEHSDVSCEFNIPVNHHQNTSVQNFQSMPTSSQLIPSSHPTVEQQRPTTTTVESVQRTEPSSECSDSVVTEPKVEEAASKETVIVINDSQPTKDPENCDKSSKPDALKMLPRFGRSRCKPVLTNPGLRKKNDIKAPLKNDPVTSDIGVIMSIENVPDTSVVQKVLVDNQPATVKNYDNISGKNSEMRPYEYVAIAQNVRTESVIKNSKTGLTETCPLINRKSDSKSLVEPNEPNNLVAANIDSKIVPPTSYPLVGDSEIVCEESDNGHKSTNCELKSASNKIGNGFIKKRIVSAHTELQNISENSVIVINLSKVALDSDSSSKQSEQDTVMKADILNANNVPHKVPLSPLKPISKVLVPKPSPRISDIGPRRISFQGSDSEDESKKKKPQVDCDKPIAQTCNSEKKENAIKKESKRKRSQGATYSKMGQETLDKLAKKFGKHIEPDKSKLTMLDLIFYNPKNNPMTAKTDNIPNDRKKKDKEEVIIGDVEEMLAEQQVDDVQETPAPSAMPVPQLKVGPDGQIILDPKSLLIEETGVEKSRAELEKSQVVQETGVTRYNTYSKKKAQRHEWSSHETLQFYKALNTVGSDFTIMAKLFPKRTRQELKLKFKREEKVNLHLVDKAMSDPSDFDFTSLEEELRKENDLIEKTKIEKLMKAEAAKKKRALTKEEKKSKRKNSQIGVKGKAMREFNENELNIKHSIKIKKRIKKKKKKKEKSELYDSDLEDDVYSLSSEEDESMKLLRIVKETHSGHRPKVKAKLEEYEEINETLRQKMQHQSDSEDEYTPNGPDADMLFRDPIEVPDEGQWNVEISNLPNIEETVLLNNNTEDVSELSGLGSFGQSESALDLSMPVRTSLQRELLHNEPMNSSLLNRSLISESIQIMDDFTSDIQCDDDSYTSAKVDPSVDEKSLAVSKLPLPSFESVSRSRPPMMYPFQTSDISINCDEVRESSVVDTVRFNFYNSSEECILGD